MTTPLTPRPTLGVLSMGTLVTGDQLVFENNEERVPVTVVGVPSHLRHIDVECNGDESFLLVEDFRSGFVTRSIN